MPYGTVNADVIQTSTSGGILGAGNASIMKNRLINGSMVVDQRNNGSSVTNVSDAATYTLDRWFYYATQASKFTIQQNSGNAPATQGFSQCVKLTSSSAYSVAAGDLFAFQQAIEGNNISDLAWGTASAKTVTLSFLVNSSLTGTFGGSLYNNANDRCYVFSYSIPVANTWTQISVTVPGCTDGTWLTNSGAGLYVAFSIGMGSNYTTTAGSWNSSAKFSVTGGVNLVGTSGATFYITGVQLEVGSSATGFEYVNYQTSLANCQRYYQISSTGYSGVASNTTTFSCVLQYPPMRTAPSVSASAALRISDVYNAAYSQSSGNVSVAFGFADSSYLNMANFTGLTAGRFSIAANNGSGILQLSAEL